LGGPYKGLHSRVQKRIILVFHIRNELKGGGGTIKGGGPWGSPGQVKKKGEGTEATTNRKNGASKKTP